MNTFSALPSINFSYINNHIETTTKTLLASCSQAFMRPIHACRETLENLILRINTAIQQRLDDMTRFFSDIGHAFYKNRFTFLYLASTAIVAFSDPGTFIKATCVGTLLSHVYSSIYPSSKTAISTNDEFVQMTRTVAQTALCCVHTTAKVLEISRWMNHSSEGGISSTLSGLAFGHAISSYFSSWGLKISL